jgi:hypothetical protein
MVEPSPETAAAEGQEPAAVEGQEPAGESGTPDAQEEQGGGRNYSEAYVKQLRREAAASRTETAELKERVAAFEDRDKSELERLVAKAEAEARRADEADLRATRYEVAAEHQIPADTAKRLLTATTREEMEAQAEELAKLLADKGRPPTVGFDGGARQPVPETKTPEEAHNELLLRSLGRRP